MRGHRGQGGDRATLHSKHLPSPSLQPRSSPARGTCTPPAAAPQQQQQQRHSQDGGGEGEGLL